MAKKLTAVTVAQAKPKAVRYEIADAGCPGLRLVVQESGAKSWLMRFRSPSERDRNGNGKARKLTLGPLAREGEACEGEPKIGRPLSVADARALASDVIRKIRQGIDPAQEWITEKRGRATASNIIDDVFAAFLAKHVRKRNGKPIREGSRRETGRLLGLMPSGEDGDALSCWKPRTPKSGVLAYWSSRDVASITKRDVHNVLDSILARGATIVANRTLSALKTFFTWCVKRDIIVVSPCDHVDDPSPEHSIERDLSGDEIVAVWRAAERTGYPYGKMVQLILLTGLRRDEVREAPRNEFDFPGHTWTLPSLRTKNGRDHLVPLSDAAMAILTKLPRIKSKAGWLFTIAGDVPISNLSRRKLRFDALMLEELQKIDPEIAELTPWRLHDLRHTLKTWMQRTRIPKDVRNAVQNHYDGDMDELYGHYSFEKEKREALDQWAQHIAGIVSGENVVELRG
jgi:integrase